MNQMTEPSMYKPSELPDWPANAIPRRWIEALFSKMSAFYGARFADLWRGTNILEVQKAWALELAKLSSAQMKAGADALTAFTKPPTLPEFIEHCKRTRLEAAAHAAVPRLEHVEPADKAVIDSNLKKLHSITGSLRLQSAHPGWAYDFFIRGTAKTVDPVTVETWGHCREAILSEAGRKYPAKQDGERAKQCYAILAKVSANPTGAIA